MATLNQQITNNDTGKTLAAYLLVYATAHNARAVRLTSKCLRDFFGQKALQRKYIQRLADAVSGIWTVCCDGPRPKSGGRYAILYLDKDAQVKKAKPATLNYLPSVSEISEKIFPAYMPQS